MLRATPIYPNMPRLGGNGLGFVWAPIIAASIATGGTFALSFTSWNKINANQKRQTSNVADQIEEKLKTLREAYLAFQGRNSEDRAYALQQFDLLWQELTTECNRIGGGAGQRCIEERRRGGKWDWFALYRDPIENAEIKEETSNSANTGIPQVPFLQNIGFGESSSGVIGIALALGLIAWGVTRK